MLPTKISEPGFLKKRENFPKMSSDLYKKETPADSGRGIILF